MNYSFKTLWNRAFYFISPLWCLLVWIIWSTDQLQDQADKIVFISIVIPGFFAVYVSGFLIEKWHNNKQQKLK
jgi:hypothetical protein